MSRSKLPPSAGKSRKLRLLITLSCAVLWAMALLAMRHSSHAELQSWVSLRADARYIGSVWWIAGTLTLGCVFAVWRWSREASTFGIWTWRLLTFVTPFCCMVSAPYGLWSLPSDNTNLRMLADMLGLFAILSLFSLPLVAIFMLVAISDDVHARIAARRLRLTVERLRNTETGP
jgi:hypothetical protein